MLKFDDTKMLDWLSEYGFQIYTIGHKKKTITRLEWMMTEEDIYITEGKDLRHCIKQAMENIYHKKINS